VRDGGADGGRLRGVVDLLHRASARDAKYECGEASLELLHVPRLVVHLDLHRVDLEELRRPLRLVLPFAGGTCSSVELAEKLRADARGSDAGTWEVLQEAPSITARTPGDPARASPA
jgi:hypothetical protein